MSSPHLGGDFLNALASKKGGSGSGRNTPTMTGSPHRSIPAQLAHPYGRPQSIVTQHNSDDDDDQQQPMGWRPITPARSSPRSTDSPTVKLHAQRGPSSRNPDNEDLQLQLHSAAQGENSTDISMESSSIVGENSLGSIEVRFSNLPPVLKGYLLGQIACVIKFGVWWVGFTYLIFALFGGDSYLVGATRICFNLALLLCSPMAGGIAEKTNIKKLLNKTVIGRGLIYCMAIPLAWVLMDSEVSAAAHANRSSNLWTSVTQIALLCVSLLPHVAPLA
jgi:hypothetical protein